jgi:hypothetical protein
MLPKIKHSSEVSESSKMKSYISLQLFESKALNDVLCKKKYYVPMCLNIGYQKVTKKNLDDE